MSAHDEAEVTVLAVAIDVQGASKVRPYVDRAGATYSNAVDVELRLNTFFGFKAVPNVIFVDDAGIIRYTKFGGYDIRKPEHREIAERFITNPDLAELERLAEEGSGLETIAAKDHFQRGLARYRDGQVDAAVSEWRRCVALEPENWVIRKQIWAIENPKRFYSGDVDFDWQREQIAQSL